MTIELSALPLALLAGMLSILSPCVWPLVPIVMGSAAGAGRRGPLALAAGLSLAFALGGSVLSFALISLGLDPELFRYVAAALLILAALPLLSSRLGLWMNNALARLTGGAPGASRTGGGAGTQFGIGMLLGLVWLPCVGPTLGAAIALASLGQQMLRAFSVMLVFGVGCALVLVLAGTLSASAVRRWRPQLLQGAGRAKRWLGGAVLCLGLLVLSGIDKWLETQALGWLPDWAVSL